MILGCFFASMIGFLFGYHIYNMVKEARQELPTYLDAKRKAKALDMALCLFEIQNNVWREFKHTDYDYEPLIHKINDCIDEHNIIVDDLVE